MARACFSPQPTPEFRLLNTPPCSIRLYLDVQVLQCALRCNPLRPLFAHQQGRDSAASVWIRNLPGMGERCGRAPLSRSIRRTLPGRCPQRRRAVSIIAKKRQVSRRSGAIGEQYRQTAAGLWGALDQLRDRLADSGIRIGVPKGADEVNLQINETIKCRTAEEIARAFVAASV
jgi:hypothetical protein